jgi:protein tyrosine phosphatase (PTP) superfamily phosphohydrolase (DUF442 family)
LFRNNFDVVDPGRVYRSGQPGDELRAVVTGRGIRSVVNLRGGSGTDGFYRGEVRVLDELGVDFYDLPMQATRRPSRGELLRLLKLLDTCRYPLLIHCKSGSDRTGLVSALYLMVRKGLPPAEALRSFSIARGHVPLFGPERLHEPFHEYDAWLAAHALDHTPARFRAWVARDYADADPDADPLPLRKGPRPRMAAGDMVRKSFDEQSVRRRRPVSSLEEANVTGRSY